MKGLQTASESNTIFLVIKHGSLCEESKSAKDGFLPVPVVNPRTGEEITKYVRKYKGVEALITKIEWRDTEQQYEQRYQSWRIHMDADGVPCILEIPFNSRASSRFMKLAENINFNDPVEFRAWHDTREDKTAFFVGQNGESVLQRYTRDNPGECPPPIQKFNGKWNFDDQMEYLHSQMINVVMPAVETANAKRQMASEAPQEGREDNEPPFDASEPESLPDDDGPPF